MTPPTSSLDLHPAHGARFVATRQGEGSPLRYLVEVFLPGGVRLSADLHWADGVARLSTSWDDTWAAGEALKLARVLKRTEKATITRWRDRGVHTPGPTESS